MSHLILYPLAALGLVWLVAILGRAIARTAWEYEWKRDIARERDARVGGAANPIISEGVS